MPYADYESDLMSYFADKIVEWQSGDDPVTLPVAWPNVVLEEDEYSKNEPWVRFDIVEARSYQPSLGREVGMTRKRTLGNIVVDVFYPHGYNWLKLKNILDKVEEALEQVRISTHTITDTSYRIDRHDYRGMKAKRIYTKFTTELIK